MLYDILSNPQGSHVGKAFSIVIMVFIILSTVVFCIETLPKYRIRKEVENNEEFTFVILEWIAVMAFSFEYFGKLLTVAACPQSYLWPPKEDKEEDAEYRGRGGRNEFRASIYGALTRRSSQVSAPQAWVQHNPSNETTPVKQIKEEDELSVDPPQQQEEQPTTIAPEENDNREKMCSLRMILKKLWWFINPVANKMNLIDFVAILPFYLELALGSASAGLTVLRVLRLGRVRNSGDRHVLPVPSMFLTGVSSV